MAWSARQFAQGDYFVSSEGWRFHITSTTAEPSPTVEASTVNVYAGEAVLNIAADGTVFVAGAKATIFDDTLFGDTTPRQAYATHGAILAQDFSSVASGALVTASGQIMVWDYSHPPATLVFEADSALSAPVLSADGTRVSVQNRTTLTTYSVATGDVLGTVTGTMVSAARDVARVATASAGGVSVTNPSGATVYAAIATSPALPWDYSDSYPDSPGLGLSPQGDLVAVTVSSGNGPGPLATNVYRGTSLVATLQGAFLRWSDDDTLVVSYLNTDPCAGVSTGCYSNEEAYDVAYTADGQELSQVLPVPSPPAQFVVRAGGFLDIE